MQGFTLDDFKNAIQGNKGGILREIQLIPPPMEIIAETQEKFLQNLELLSSNDVDKQLVWLLDHEYEIYTKYQQNVYSTFFREMNKWVGQNPNIHPCLDALSGVLEQRVTDGTKLIDLVSDQIPLAIVALEGSISQGRRSRAGGSLMEQLEFVLELHQIKYGKHFLREQKVGGKQPTKLDYVFPSIEFMEKNANQSVTCANMTTINDRYRLALQQLQPNTHRKVLTALGANAYIGQENKLSENILTDFRNNQVKVVVLANSRNKFKRSQDVIQTYTEWFDELKILSRFW